MKITLLNISFKQCMQSSNMDMKQSLKISQMCEQMYLPNF